MENYLAHGHGRYFRGSIHVFVGTYTAEHVPAILNPEGVKVRKCGARGSQPFGALARGQQRCSCRHGTNNQCAFKNTLEHDRD
jgi:hypothetical protein